MNEALIIDMSRHLDQVLELNTEDKWVRVQPGMVLDEQNLYLRDKGLQFGPDPASSNRAGMGGIVFNQSQVVLFHDTFNSYNYPTIAVAATEVLEAAGSTVLLPGHKCCGRPMISKGLVKEARAAAQDTIKRLAPFAKPCPDKGRKGIPIVGLEPSCLLTNHT